MTNYQGVEVEDDTRKLVKRVTFAVIGVIALIFVIVNFINDSFAVTFRWWLNHIWTTMLFPSGPNIFKATPFFWMLLIGTVLGIAWWRSYRKYKRQVKARAAGKQAELKRIESLRHANYNDYSKQLREFNQKYDNPVYHSSSWKRFKALTFGRFPGLSKVTAAFLVLCLGVSTWTIFMWSDWNARHYNSASVYVVENTDSLPLSLKRISESPRSQVGIEEGVMPDDWEPRVASATGATHTMKRAGESNSNVKIMPETVTYIYNKDGDGGQWTAIRNASKRLPIFGIATWAGTGNPVVSCEFRGEHSLNKAFDSTFGMNLTNVIAAYNPQFVYDTADMYGYCDGDKPVIVIPGAKMVGNVVQRAYMAHGVLIITGSPSGKPVFEYKTDVEPGELPGPVYPTSLTTKQRDALSWSAGRIWPWNPAVGYSESKAEAQSGNNSDFLLRSRVDGRLYWVTPLEPANTDSNLIVGFAVIAADEMHAGKLNQQRIYIMNDGDSRIVSLQTMLTKAATAVKTVMPGFFNGPEASTEEEGETSKSKVSNIAGSIVEFIPLGGGEWLVFAETGGQAVFQVLISDGGLMNTTVMNADTPIVDKTGDNYTSDVPPEKDCNNPEGLSESAIGDCLVKLGGALQE